MVSRELGVAGPTLYAWKRQFESKGFLVPANSSNPEKWDSKSKLAAIIQTASMNEAERSAYCREHGLYPEQLDAWRAGFESADTVDEPVSKAAIAAERKKVKQLERELRRKENVAKLARPDRWKNRSTRNWDPIDAVWLNPTKEHCNNRADLKRAA
jgi:transposase-like protein